MVNPLNNWHSRPLSWSQLSAWTWNKSTWYEKYILGKKQESKEMDFGKKFAESIENNTCEIKELMANIQPRKEYPYKVVFAGITLCGFADAVCDKTFKKIDEVKTGKKKWDQKRVDNHHQITMYVLMNYITHKIPPEEVDCTLFWIPTEETGSFTIDFAKPIKVHTFHTKRTMSDILQFGECIKKTKKEMEEYIKLAPLAPLHTPMV